jgi:virginiamycin B lyase
VRKLFAMLVPLPVLAAIALPSTAVAVSTTKFALSAEPLGVALGSDGNVWFATGASLGRVTPAGVVTEFTEGLPAGSHLDGDIVLGSDGNVWFADPGAKAVGRITPAGTITEFHEGILPGGAPVYLTLGGDGNVWFVDDEGKGIGRVKTSGAISEFPDEADPSPSIESVTTGPEGDVWFTDKGAKPAIGRVTPTGKIDVFTSGLDAMPSPDGITAAPDGNLYFDESGSPEGFGKVTPGGTIQILTTGLQENPAPDEMAAGPEGNLWFVDQENGTRTIGRIKPTGQIEEFEAGHLPTPVDGIAFGLDGNLWALQEPGILRVTEAGLLQPIANAFEPQNGDGSDVISGSDGNLWISDRSDKAIVRLSLDLLPQAATGAAGGVTTTSASVAGTVTPLGSTTSISFEYGTTPALGQSAPAGTLAPGVNASPLTATIAGLPSATTVYYRVSAKNATGAAQGATASFKTAGSAPTSAGAATTLVTTTFGNQKITLTGPAPGVCTSSRLPFSISLSSTTAPRSKAAKLHFVKVSYYLDKGVRHLRKRVVHAHGHKTTLFVVSYRPNAVVAHLPAKGALKLTGLKSGKHTLRATISYRKLVVKNGRRVAVTVVKKISVQFAVC